MTAKLELRGGPQLHAALEELGNSIARRLAKNATRAGARVIANAAKQRVPVLTGCASAQHKARSDLNRQRKVQVTGLGVKAPRHSARWSAKVVEQRGRELAGFHGISDSQRRPRQLSLLSL
jgi:hypothetical protein